jgi:hypothetical protein
MRDNRSVMFAIPCYEQKVYASNARDRVKSLLPRMGIEVLRPRSDEVIVFARRLDSSVAFDCRIQFLSEGLVRFFFRAPPSHQVWKVMRYMDFQPADRRNQIWVRKSGSYWSAK